MQDISPTSPRRLIFRATTAPRRVELHCLWSHLTDKAHQNRPDAAFRIEMQGRLVHVLTNEPVRACSVALERISFELLRVEPVRLWTYQTGDIVRLNGTMAYSVHNGMARANLCPIDALGRVRDDLRKPFFRYIERSIGVAMEPRQGREFMSFALDLNLADDSVRPGIATKAHLHHGIQFEILSRVIDAATFNRLAYAAVGRRRAYGMGAVSVLDFYRPQACLEGAGVAVEG